MPLVKVDVVGDVLAAPEKAQEDLGSALARTSPEAPVVVLIHGYRFSPAFEPHSPHTHIFSLSPERADWKALSWPRQLGLGSGSPDEPLCIALGWEARGSLWQAYGRAAETGRALAGLIALVRRFRPGQRVDVLAHSLGCRVALSALPFLPARSMGRAVLMAPAELRSRAVEALDTSAGRTVEILNVTSRQNGLYDRLLEWVLAPFSSGDRSLGAGLSHLAGNWIDLNIDHRDTRTTLELHGYPVAAADRRICHWSVYLRPGLFPFYRAVVHREFPLASLRSKPWYAARTRAGGRFLPPLTFAS